MTPDARALEAEKRREEPEIEALRARVAELEEEARGLRQIVAQQSAALAEVVTPLIPITERMMVMPIIGVIDMGRAGEVISTLLSGVSRNQARVAILDVTGVTQADAQTAEALVAAARAVELLGARVVLTGVQPQVARSFIEIGVDLSGIPTERTLRDGIARGSAMAGAPPARWRSAHHP